MSEENYKEYCQFVLDSEKGKRPEEETDRDRKALGIFGMHTTPYILHLESVRMSKEQTTDLLTRNSMVKLESHSETGSRANEKDEEKAFKKKLDEVKTSDSFAKRLKKAESGPGTDDGKWSSRAEELCRKAPLDDKKVKAKKAQMIQLVKDIRAAESKVKEIEGIRDAFLSMPQLEGMEEKVNEQFRMEINFAVFVAESALQCLEYIISGTEPDYLHGSYIRRRWSIDCNHIDPGKTLAEQMPQIEECFSDISGYECSRYPFTLALEKRGIPGQRGELLEKDIDEAYRKLLEKKDANPDLFLEPGILRLFKYVPQMIEIFEDARILRNALAKNKSEKKDSVHAEMYETCSAIYNTLLRRHRFMISASVLTSSGLIEERPSYRSASFSYCLRELK